MVLEPLVCDSIDEQKYKKWEKLCYDNGGDINDIIIVIIKIKFVRQVLNGWNGGKPTHTKL